jgi:hypothetical protein
LFSYSGLLSKSFFLLFLILLFFLAKSFLLHLLGKNSEQLVFIF